MPLQPACLVSFLGNFGWFLDVCNWQSDLRVCNPAPAAPPTSLLASDKWHLPGEKLAPRYYVSSYGSWEVIFCFEWGVGGLGSVSVMANMREGDGWGNGSNEDSSLWIFPQSCSLKWRFWIPSWVSSSIYTSLSLKFRTSISAALELLL